MANGVNKVILIGYLGQDPELKYLHSGTAAANVSLATAEQWKDKQTGEKQERTEWHRLQFFGRTAEIAGEYLKKGALLYVEGQNRTRKWQDNAGNDRYVTEVIVGKMTMLGGRNGNGSQGDNYGGGQRPSANASPPAPEGPSDDFDDDIPF